jgi:hypothetical protein
MLTGAPVSLVLPLTSPSTPFVPAAASPHPSQNATWSPGAVTWRT